MVSQSELSVSTAVAEIQNVFQSLNNVIKREGIKYRESVGDLISSEEQEKDYSLEQDYDEIYNSTSGTGTGDTNQQNVLEMEMGLFGFLFLSLLIIITLVVSIIFIYYRMMYEVVPKSPTWVEKLSNYLITVQNV